MSKEQLVETLLTNARHSLAEVTEHVDWDVTRANAMALELDDLKYAVAASFEAIRNELEKQVG